MSKKTYVVGHKNPDTDSIVASIAFAELLRLQGVENVVAARQGDIWRETRYLLDRFAVPLPELIDDVRARARDVMATAPVLGSPNESAYRVGRRLRDRGIRAMPLVDADRRLAGVVSVEDFASVLLVGLERDQVDQVQLDIDNVVETLGGQLLFEAHGRRLRDKVMVAAMDVETMRSRLEPDIMLVMGDREDAQRAAIQEQIGALVVTGGLPLSDGIVALARERNVSLISSPHHTFATVRLLDLSVPISSLMRRDVLTAGLDDPLDELRDKLVQQRTVPVLDAKGRVVGVVSRSDLINPVRHAVYLVDHNERSQTVDGLDEAELLGIIDHHRIGDIQTAAPILFRNEIVGSTSTLVAGLYAEAQLPIPAPMAGILLGAQISDTVLFRSPTSTARDEQVARQLATLAGVQIEALGQEIFAVASDLSGRTPREILTTDLKEFRLEDVLFAVGYMETVDRQRLDDMRALLLAEMRAIRSERGFASFLFMIVNIIAGETEILVSGMEQQIADALGRPLATPHSAVVSGIMSRKKQVVPILPQVARQVKTGGRSTW